MDPVGEITGAAHVYVVALKLLTGVDVKLTPLHEVLERFDTTGEGFIVTIKLKAFPGQLNALGVIE